MFFYYKKNTYIAIIGDIKDSKNTEDRKEVQNRLKNVLGKVNERHKNQLASKFIITLGDEFQGLLCDGTSVMHILLEIETAMHPVRIRFGFGVGAITTDINPAMSLGADGPAYYNARSAVEFLKENENKKKAIPLDYFLAAGNENDETALWVNTIFSLLKVIEDSWSERQREIIRYTLFHKENQSQIALQFKIKQPAVYKNLEKGNYYTYKQALETLEQAFGEIKR